jgi:hypothetical protein
MWAQLAWPPLCCLYGACVRRLQRRCEQNETLGHMCMLTLRCNRGVCRQLRRWFKMHPLSLRLSALLPRVTRLV